ncbi:DUF3107 domain-containing protein [Nocardioides daphniae]|uniref:DUF3107 domain-containing protein n=1 Tax=Nocardioides daphniae TaxID=402297 RepID=A0A4P7UC87_9ACTN|nr:DUF3107 domain-containing protein [Nocardioides daphniae]QCC77812.1 DUF3107 domain-containing protein [Nocardioides daphniae]GGD28075.1 hypothetical protein GCM10007231_29470 [Nocardioides daphniae]
MEVKIGIQNAARELVVDVTGTQEEITAKVTEAVQGGTLTLSDVRGRLVLVPGEKIAYVELGHASTGTVGFR